MNSEGIDLIIAHCEAMVAYYALPTGPVEWGIREGWNDALRVAQAIRDGTYRAPDASGERDDAARPSRA